MDKPKRRVEIEMDDKHNYIVYFHQVAKTWEDHASKEYDYALTYNNYHLIMQDITVFLNGVK